jgi:hypothetical protein
MSCIVFISAGREVVLARAVVCTTNEHVADALCVQWSHLFSICHGRLVQAAGSGARKALL